MALKLDELAQLCDLHAKNYHAIMFMLKTVPKIIFIPICICSAGTFFILPEIVTGFRLIIFHQEVKH